MKWVISLLAILVVLAAAFVGASRLHLLDGVYTALLGPPDLGAIAFGRLTRRASGADALACPPGECGSATVDLRPPAYPSAANDLRQQVRRHFAAQGAVLVGAEEADMHDRFVVRSELLRLPETVDVQIFPTDAGHATLAAYSRSQLGFADFGASLRRIKTLLEALGPGVASASLGIAPTGGSRLSGRNDATSQIVSEDARVDPRLLAKPRG